MPLAAAPDDCALSCPSSARTRCSMHCKFLRSSSFEICTGAAWVAGATGGEDLTGSPTTKVAPSADIAEVRRKPNNIRRRVEAVQCRLAMPCTSLFATQGFDDEVAADKQMDRHRS